MRTDFHSWQMLWNHLGLLEGGAKWHRRLLMNYSEARRTYHSLQHLNECLLEFDAARATGEMIRPELVEIALWFHDAVYDPQSSENERLSAEMALEALGDTADGQEVARQIMLTNSHQLGDGVDDAWIIDIDLAIFGQDTERVVEYEQQIRQEYAWVPEALYRDKRSEILAGFLTRERIYKSEFFNQRYDESARKNLVVLIARLKQ